jgi:2-oxoisovalerate dehydrogenase E1 component
MHLFAPDIGLMGTSGIVGPCILQATGAGYTFKLLGTDRVGGAFFGDGAVNNGAFHEGLNMAAIWDLPVVFVCENNLYATEVAFSYASKNPSVASRAEHYGMPGIEVDGNDVVAVYDAAEEAVLRARRGEGPTLIEARTYRTRSHAEGMPDMGYRTEEEVASWKQRDPIDRLRRLIQTEIHVENHVIESIEAQVTAEIEDAEYFAENSAYPEPATSNEFVYRQ